MACQQELRDGAPRVDHPRAARLDLHPFLDGEGAGGGEVRLSLDLHHAHAAGAAGEQLLDVAEGGDLLPRRLRRLEDRGARLCLYLPVVDCYD